MDILGYLTLFLYSLSRLGKTVVPFCFVTFYVAVVGLYFDSSHEIGRFTTYPDESYYLAGNLGAGIYGAIASAFDVFGLAAILKVVQVIIFAEVVNLSVKGLNRSKKVIFVCIALPFSYWCFFFLKEAIFISLLLLFYTLRVDKKVFMIPVIILVKYEMLVLFAAQYLTKFKKTAFYLSFAFASVVLYVDTLGFLKPVKYQLLARRFGAENKNYDSVSANGSDLGLFDFLFSDPYFQLLSTNFSETFNFLNAGSIVIYFKFINFLALILSFFYYRRNVNLFYIAVSVLLATHSVYRYLIPFSLVVVFLCIRNDFNFNKEKF